MALQFISFSQTYGHYFATGDLPELTTATFVGIMVAITGNVLISLALNLQKLAHKRVEAKKLAKSKEGDFSINGATIGRPGLGASEPARSEAPSLDETDEDRQQTHASRTEHESVQVTTHSSASIAPETRPLIPFPQSPPSETYYTAGFGDGANKQTSRPQSKKLRSFLSRFRPSMRRGSKTTDPDTMLEGEPLLADVLTEEAVVNGGPHVHKNSKDDDQGDVGAGNESDYLKSKLWWLGFALMNVGELGNFISYAWAPASVVAPLGTFALMANCVFAPLMLGEHFRMRDLLGIFIAIIGAVTVVLASNASDVRLDPDALLHAIAQPAFLIYSAIYVVGAIILATLSQGRLGRQWVFVDIGLCAIFGGFTVLSTKAVSTLLTMQWIEMFTKWITYPVLAVLILTGIGQIRYINRALMRFDSKVVIPTQFVLFTLSAIIGSAILYGDFKTAKFHQIVTFLYGCAATFLGVFIIAWAPNGSQRENGEGSQPDDEANGAVTSAPRDGEGARLGLGLGAVGKRQRATLILPSGVKDPSPLRHKRSAVSLIGLSPAQHLLLVHTPPREGLGLRTRDFDGDLDVERGAWTPDSSSRLRTFSWLGDESRRNVRDDRTRDSSIVGRLRSPGVDMGRVNSSPYPDAQNIR